MSLRTRPRPVRRAGDRYAVSCTRLIAPASLEILGQHVALREMPNGVDDDSRGPDHEEKFDG